MKTIKDIKSIMEETKKEHPYSYFVDENEELSQRELETGLMSQLRLMNILFTDCISADTLWENHFENQYLEEIRTPYTIAEAKKQRGEQVDESDYYDDEYQHFIVKLNFDKETTQKILERADTDIYLRYSEENDLYFMSVGNLGTHRSMVSTNIRLTNNYDEQNYYDDDDVIQDKIVSDVDSALDNGSSENSTDLSTDSKNKSGKEV